MIFALLAVAMLAPAAAAGNSASVITATATSSAPSAAPVICLLKPDCAGSWSPGSADSGANEGVYVQFEGPVNADAVELVTNVKDSQAPLILSINGAPARATASKQPASSAAGRYTLRYAIAGNSIKSLFFRLGVRKGGWQNFSLYSIRFYLGKQLLTPALPVAVTGSVTASSVLAPEVAYQPANLFDSRYDFAWSTNGQTTQGKGEFVEIKFDQPQELAGMIVWNGYQRSSEHFKANGRIRKLTVNAGGVSESFSLSDTMGGQRISFSKPMQSASFKLTIDEVTRGAKYPDVLLSELRFVDGHDQIVIPQVKGISPEPNALVAGLIDRSFSSVVCGSSISPLDFQKSLRFRRNGSFVIYGKAFDEEERKTTDQVMEGNWQFLGSAIRIFGKRYSETAIDNEYGHKAYKTPPSIFQSDLTIAKFHDLAPQKKQELAELIWTRISSKLVEGGGEGEVKEIRGVGKSVLAKSDDQEEKNLVLNLVKSLEKMNPWTVSSPILADAMMASDDVGSCETEF
jgi:hypothetical protein